MERATLQEELVLIRRLMDESQRVIYDHGKHYIVWGLLISAALLLTYGAVALDYPISLAAVWAGAVVLGWIASFWVGWHDSVRATARTLAGQLLAAIWVGVGITLTLLGFLGAGSGAITGGALNAMVASVIGTGYFATSYLHRSGWVRASAAGWWAGAAIMLLWPGTYTLLLLAGLFLALGVLPGVLLYWRTVNEAGRRAE